MDEEATNPEISPHRTPFKLFAGGLIAVTSLLGFLILGTQPGEGGPLLVLAFLLLVFLQTTLLSLTLLSLVQRLKKKPALSWTRLIYTSVVIGMGVVFLVGLQTLRQLQAIDFILVFAFELLINFYLLRRF